MYDPQLGRWHSVDPSAERDHALSPYVYCANNPVKLIDPDGRWFDDKNEKKAERIERRAERRGEKLDSKAERLEARGKDATDLRARSAELRKVGQNIKDMGLSPIEFRYANMNDKSNPAGVGNPVTSPTGENDKGEITQVTMFVEGNTGQQIHETTHGGDVARGTLDPSPDSKNYGVSDEISAYRAQYAYDGSFSYRPADSPLKNYAPPITVNNIGSINANLVNNIGAILKTTDRNGNTYYYWGNLYPINIKQWNNN